MATGSRLKLAANLIIQTRNSFSSVYSLERRLFYRLFYVIGRHGMKEVTGIRRGQPLHHEPGYEWFLVDEKDEGVVKLYGTSEQIIDQLRQVAIAIQSIGG